MSTSKSLPVKKKKKKSKSKRFTVLFVTQMLFGDPQIPQENNGNATSIQDVAI